MQAFFQHRSILISSFPRCIPVWNSLPPEAVNAQLLPILRREEYVKNNVWLWSPIFQRLKSVRVQIVFTSSWSICAANEIHKSITTCSKQLRWPNTVCARYTGSVSDGIKRGARVVVSKYGVNKAIPQFRIKGITKLSYILKITQFLSFECFFLLPPSKESEITKS